MATVSGGRAAIVGASSKVGGASVGGAGAGVFTTGRSVGGCLTLPTIGAHPSARRVPTSHDTWRLPAAQLAGEIVS